MVRLINFSHLSPASLSSWIFGPGSRSRPFTPMAIYYPWLYITHPYWGDVTYHLFLWPHQHRKSLSHAGGWISYPGNGTTWNAYVCTSFQDRTAAGGGYVTINIYSRLNLLPKNPSGVYEAFVTSIACFRPMPEHVQLWNKICSDCVRPG